MLNKVSIIIIIVLGFKTSILFSHDSAISLQKYEQRGSLYWTFSGGANYMTALYYNDENIVVNYTDYAVTSEFDYSLGASVFLYEYGLSEQFSLGLNLSLIEFFRNKIDEDHWTLYGAFFARYNLPAKITSGKVHAHVVSKIFLSPIFSFPEENKSNWVGDGLINWFNTISVNYPIYNKQKHRWFLYTDLKHISTFIDEDYGSAAFSEADLSGLGYSQEELDNITHGYGSANKIAICPGIEYVYNKFSIHLGVNFILATYHKDAFWGPELVIGDFHLNNFELAWSYRF